MLAKMTSKNQVTLPKAVTNAVGSPGLFEVEVEDGRIVLTPVTLVNADAVRRKLAELGITTDDVSDAVRFARRDRA
ncbi:MAG: AbrB/MazE/SpoVT family DNA-binding domain-containing protein [Candidatus Eremiobacteraeota bacterium]|uniref:SpoVT-AbrB domain-containing protein n=1 Tax=mine drainage metagenome TaxID=410659 RepID=E6PDB0_9ZZZZ|nr:AbrB/MazE/SpoVT family DNA-binding domain-containing protein [Candidatus Eremiobacteraeota bacterium]NNM91784.1 AbrB/MazE/SpoVT family DNA-binding domain-containing protein [Candidatus Eremiobacteraeota bacterium]